MSKVKNRLTQDLNSSRHSLMQPKTREKQQTWGITCVDDFINAVKLIQSSKRVLSDIETDLAGFKNLFDDFYEVIR